VGRVADVLIEVPRQPRPANVVAARALADFADTSVLVA
jgi:hypothetical protein